MALADALASLMAARGLSAAALARRLGTHRSTVHHLLSGATIDPRLSTVLALCTALEDSPTELLELADLWPRHERSGEALDVRLRLAFAQVQALPLPEKERAVRLLAAVARALAEPPSPSV